MVLVESSAQSPTLPKYRSSDAAVTVVSPNRLDCLLIIVRPERRDGYATIERLCHFCSLVITMVMNSRVFIN